MLASTTILKRLRENRLPLISLLVLLLISSARDATLLLRHPVAVGIDGYYYILQISQFTAKSQFYFPTQTPLVLYALTALSRYLGSAVVAVKVASLLCHLFLSLGIFAIIKSAVRQAWLAVLGAALAALPRLHYYMIAEFINNLGALTLLVWCIYFAIQYLQTRRRRFATWASILFVAAILSHRSVFLIAVAILVSAWLFHWFVIFNAHGRFNWYALFVALIIYVAPALAAWQHSIGLPPSIANQISASPHWPLSLWCLPEGLLLLLSAAIALLLLLLGGIYVGHKSGTYLIGVSTLCALLLTLCPFYYAANELTGVVGRLRVLAYIESALIVPGLISLTLHWRRDYVIYALSAVLPLLLVGVAAELPYGLNGQLLARRERLIQGLKEHAADLPSNAMIVAPHGDQFVITETTGIPSVQPSSKGNGDRPVYWLLDIPQKQIPVPGAFNIATDDNSSIILVNDGVFKQYLQDSDDGDRRRLLRSNPQFIQIINGEQSEQL
jgi:hypothetical protein